MNERPSRAGRAALALCANLVLAGGAWAAPSDAERIADLENRLEALARRLLEVEARSAAQPGRPVAQAAAPAPAPEPSVVAARPAGRLADAGVPIHAFVDVGFARDSPDPAGRRGGFALGTLDLYMTPSFGERIKSIIELVFEQSERGGVVADLERVQLGYTFNDALTGWIGRFHTPYGYWNTAFHHGAQIQTSVLRPRFLAFEDQGGILPAHTVGLLGSGSVPLGDGRLKYDVFAGNGSSIADGVLAVNGFKDDGRRKTLGVNLRHDFGAGLRGLTLGVHALTSGVSAYDAAGTLVNRTALNVGGAFAVFERQGWEAIGEYYAFRNRDLTGGTGTHASWAGFGQVGYTFAEVLTSYGRYEKAALNQNDGYFSAMTSGRSYRRASLGLRYDLNPTTALKLEFGRTTEAQAAGDASSNGLRGQVAVRF